MGEVKDYVSTFLVVVLSLILAALLLYVFVFLPPVPGEGGMLETTTTSVILETSTTPIPDSTLPDTSTTSTASTTSTTSTLIPIDGLSGGIDRSVARLVVDLSSGKSYGLSQGLYDGDDLVVLFNSSGVGSISVFLDGGFSGYAGGGLFWVRDLGGGVHNISFRQGENYVGEVVSVDKSRYGLSPDVRILLTGEERNALIGEGKANVRFYDRPNCANCAVMRPRVADLVEEFRYCVGYEFVNIWKPEVREDLIRVFPDQSQVVTPVIMVEGLNGRYVYQGLVSSERLTGDILKIAPGCGG